MHLREAAAGLGAPGLTAGPDQPAGPGQAGAGETVGASIAPATEMIASQQVRFGIAAQVVAIEAAQARAAAALAARQHAAHVAHNQHVTLLAARARAAAAAKRAAQLAAKQAAAQRAAQQAAAQQAAKQQAEQQSATQVATPSGSAQQIAEAMLAQFGWSGQFSCLDSLWAHESGWSTTAENPSSGAYGIPQALPGSKMASAGPDWQTNAATQIRWGLEYIQSTYGSPCSAWSHEESTGWY